MGICTKIRRGKQMLVLTPVDLSPISIMSATGKCRLMVEGSCKVSRHVDANTDDDLVLHWRAGDWRGEFVVEGGQELDAKERETVRSLLHTALTGFFADHAFIHKEDA